MSNQDLSFRVLLETLEQGALYLEAGGSHLEAERLRLLASALYRRPHICEPLQEEMTCIMVENIRSMLLYEQIAENIDFDDNNYVK